MGDDQRAMRTLPDVDLRELMRSAWVSRNQWAVRGRRLEAAEANDFAIRLLVELDRRKADAQAVADCEADLADVQVVQEPAPDDGIGHRTESS